jgi:ABC-type multidrug transport system ATPase subunit
MTIIPVKRKSKSGNVYYNLIDEKRINGKIVQKYVGYLGKSPNSKSEVKPKDILQYIERLLNMQISQEEINSILKKIGIEYDAWPITKIIIENDLKMNKVFLKLK